MGFSFNRISDFFVVVVIVVVIVVQEVLHERGFSELGASRAKNQFFRETNSTSCYSKYISLQIKTFVHQVEE